MISSCRVNRNVKIHHRELREMHLILVHSGVFIPLLSASFRVLSYSSLVFPKQPENTELVSSSFFSVHSACAQRLRVVARVQRVVSFFIRFLSSSHRAGQPL